MGVRIDSDNNIAWVDLEESASAAEVRSRLEELLEHPEYRPDLDLLYDCRRADFSTMRVSHLQNLARFLASRGYRPPHSALVVARDVDYGVARMWQVYAEAAPTTRRVFRDMEKARRWLLSSRER